MNILQKKLLSLVVPIGPMRDDWDNIYSCLSSTDSLSRIQLIVVHQDKSHLLCDQWLEKLEVHCETQMLCTGIEGPGQGRNRGLLESTGEWVSFWDSDDFIYIAEIQKILESTTGEVDMVIGDYETRDLKQEIGNSPLIPHKILDLGLNVGLWRMVFRNNSIRHVKFPNIFMAEDQIFFYRIKPSTLNLLFSRKIVYQYRIGENESLTKNQFALQDLCVSLKVLLEEESTLSPIENQLLSLLVFKQFVTLRRVRVNNLLKMRPFFLIKARNLRKIIKGGIVYIRLR